MIHDLVPITPIAIARTDDSEIFFVSCVRSRQDLLYFLCILKAHSRLTFPMPIVYWYVAQSLGMGQLHWAPPFGWQEEAYWEGLAELRAAGRVQEVGLSNYGPKGVSRAHRFLAGLDTPLASNQVRSRREAFLYVERWIAVFWGRCSCCRS